jgi:glycosyltransferase involved in cell wall biosynthesis
MLVLKKLYWSGAIKLYEIIHFNHAESFLLFKKIPGQLAIFEINGFDVGVCGKEYLKDLHTVWKKKLGALLDALITKKIVANIQKADVFYVSTPDLVKPIEAWCGRTPTWLPNPVDTAQFTPDGPIKKLAGNPACFLAARLHGDKKPEVAFEIFEKHILPKYPNAVLHLLTTGELVNYYKLKTENSPRFSWLPFMDKPTLASVIRGADLVFGDFSIGALSLLPMQVMLSKKPIVTLDHYEIIKTPVEKLPELALKLLSDEQFRKETVEKNYQYVVNAHSPASVCKTHMENLRPFIK